MGGIGPWARFLIREDADHRSALVLELGFFVGGRAVTECTTLRTELVAATAALQAQRQQRIDIESKLRERDADLVVLSVQSTQAVAARKALETQLRTLQSDLDAEQQKFIKMQLAKKRLERDTDFVNQALQNAGEARVKTLLAQLEEKNQQLRLVRGASDRPASAEFGSWFRSRWPGGSDRSRLLSRVRADGQRAMVRAWGSAGGAGARSRLGPVPGHVEGQARRAAERGRSPACGRGHRRCRACQGGQPRDRRRGRGRELTSQGGTWPSDAGQRRGGAPDCGRRQPGLTAR